MPDPADYDEEEDWMAACMHATHAEGKPHDQSIAQCMNMWRDRNKKNLPLTTRAWSTLTIKAVNAAERTIEGIASTPEPDRLGDIVEPMGAKFALPMPLLWQHKHDQPVGHVVHAQATEKGITFKARLAQIDEPGELKNLVDKAWQAIKAGLVRGVSIGFRPSDYEPIGKSGGIKFKAWDWYELSLVTIPAHQSATISVIRSLDRAASGSSDVRPGASGIGSINLKLKEPKMGKTITEQIAALEASRAAKSARMTEVMQKSMDEGRSTDDTEREEFDTLERELDRLDGDLKRLHTLERTTAAKAVPVGEAKTLQQGADARSSTDTTHIRVTAPQLPPGIRFARVAKCIGMAQGNKVAAVQVAEQAYGDDQGIVNVLKAAIAAGTTTHATWAGALVGDKSKVFADFVEFLRPMTILGRFGSNGIPSLRRVPFRVALIAQTGGGAGYWVGEGKAKPLTDFAFTRQTLEPLKAANIAVVTDEVLRDSSPSAEMIIRNSLAAALSERIDTDFIDPAKAAVAGISPASITNGVSAINSSGVDGDAVRADIRAVFAAFIAADNPPTSGVWIMSANTALALNLMTNALGQPEFPNVSMAGGTLNGLPIIVSEYVTGPGASPGTYYVVLANASDIYLGDDGGISIDMSREASLEMSSTPTGNVGPSGSPPAPVATSLVSLWQTNSVGFRAERTLNWLKRRAYAVQLLSGVNWGA